jgi:hypothetical protein
LVLVNEPGEEDLEEGPQPKPKSSSSKKRKNVNAELSKDQISILLKTTFDIVGSREGLELWKITQKEAELIAEPLAQLMNRNPFISGAASKYGDYIALIIAICTVILPRAFVQFASKEKKKKEGINSYVSITKVNDRPAKNEPANPGNEGRKVGSGIIEPNRNATTTRAIPSQELYNILPAIQ